MKLRSKTLLALGAVGLLPIAVLGSLSFSVNRDELEKTVGSAQEALAVEAARGSEHALARLVEELRASVAMLPFDQLKDSDLTSALHIPYAQLQSVDALAVLGAQGAPVVAPLADRPQMPLGPEDVRIFLAHAPWQLAAEAGTALGAPYANSRGATRIAIAVRVSTQPLRVVAAEAALAEGEQAVAGIGRNGAVAMLLAGDGKVLASSALGKAQEGERELARTALLSQAPLTRIVQREGKPWLASSAPISSLGWAAVVMRPTRLAFAPALRVRTYIAYWAAVALLLTLLLGVMLSRQLTGPVAELRRFAKALHDGKYDEKAAVGSGDELGELADTFNHMATQVQRRDAEIRAWNDELQKRVEAKGAELRAAQDQILRTRRLAAIGSLGAGLAHELNNPLMAIAGLAAIVQRRPRDETQAAQLRQMQEQVVRVATIVEDLRRFSEQEREGAGRRFALEESVRNVLSRYEPDLSKRQIDLQLEIQPNLRAAEGDPIQIEQVVEQLVKNAIQAMPEGGKLSVGVAGIADDSVKLTVADTGRGIPAALRERIFDPFFTTKEKGTGGSGLGLSITHSIVEAHHGKILVDSAEGQGSTFTVVLPAAAAAAHLA